MTLGATTLLLGTLAGFRHAFEPDHVAAVSTLVTEQPEPLRAARLGIWWGLGHTTALAALGLALALLDATVPGRLEQAFELGVAVMLFALGAKNVRHALVWQDRDDSLVHRWFGLHTHSGLRAHLHVGRRTFVLRPLTIGLVHGLAGSGALTALALSTLPTTSMRLFYTVLFGLASTFGMATVSGLAGLSLARFTPSERVLNTVSMLTGVLSIPVAAVWSLPIVLAWVR